MIGRGIVVAGFAWAVALAASAQEPEAADIAQARQLFNEGVEHLHGERWSEACESFARSNALVQTAQTHLNLAVCSDHLGRLLDQSENLRAFIRLAGADVEPARVEQARATVAELEDRIPTVVVRVLAPEDAQLTLTIAGVEVPRATWGNPRPVNPGVVEVRASGPAHVEHVESFELRAGDRLDAEIRPTPRPVPLPEPAAPEPPAPVSAPTTPVADPAPAPSGVRWAWWITASVVLAVGLSVGGYFLFRDDGVSRPSYPPGTRVYEALRLGPQHLSLDAVSSGPPRLHASPRLSRD